MSVTQFRRNPRPDSDVVHALEAALAAAKMGHVRSLLMVTLNPLNEAETASFGQLEGSSRFVAIGALSALAHELLQEPA